MYVCNCNGVTSKAMKDAAEAAVAANPGCESSDEVLIHAGKDGHVCDKRRCESEILAFLAAARADSPPVSP